MRSRSPHASSLVPTVAPEPHRFTRRGVLRLLSAVAGASLPLVGCVARSTSNAASSPSRIRWATGGAKAVVGSFPDPFPPDDEKPSARALTCALTLGPCHAASVERRDITARVQNRGVAACPRRSHQRRFGRFGRPSRSSWSRRPPGGPGARPPPRRRSSRATERRGSSRRRRWPSASSAPRARVAAAERVRP